MCRFDRPRAALRSNCTPAFLRACRARGCPVNAGRASSYRPAAVNRRAVPSHPCKQPTSVSCTQRVNAAPGEPRTPRRPVRLSRLSRHDRASDSAQPALPPRLPLCSPRRNATGVEGVRRRELRIVRRDSAVLRSGGRPVYRKAGRLPPPVAASGNTSSNEKMSRSFSPESASGRRSVSQDVSSPSTGSP